MVILSNNTGLSEKLVRLFLNIIIFVLLVSSWSRNVAEAAKKVKAQLPEDFVLAQPAVEPPPECSNTAYFGTFVKMSGDGKTAAASCYFQPVNLGYVFVYVRSPETGLWSQQAFLNGTDKIFEASEGLYMAFSHDGDTLATRSGTDPASVLTSVGSVYVYV